MKILHPPVRTPAPDWWHDVALTCHHCGCVFQLQPNDLARVHRAPAIVAAPCPHCDATAAASRPAETPPRRPLDPRQVRPR